MTLPDTPASGVDESTGITHAGIALQAQDTGRVLMLQRAQTPDDPNSGLWEFPGGSLEPGEDPYEGASREFGEEVGVAVPEDAKNGGTSWDLPPEAPKYRLHLLTVPSEKSINLYADDVPNPDDLQGVARESVAFWDPTHITGDHIRPEVLESMKTIGDTLTKPAVVAAAPPADDVPVEEKVADLLQQIRAIHQGHMDGTVPDNAASQQSLLDLINACRELVAPPEPAVEVTPSDAMVASAAPVAPPDEWFEPFELDGPTPLTVTADGRVFGHLTTWDSCHRGGQYSDKCQRPPSDPKAPFFHLGQVLTASGNAVDVGVITVGGGHWTKQGLMTTLEHHDDVTAAAATVVVKEDKYGIGLFGSVTPDATPQMVAALRRSPVSGAWRKERGVHRLKGVHAVNDPGYPVPRSLVASADGNDIVVVDRVPTKEPVVDLSAAARRLARAAGLDMDSLVASARAAMADIDCGCDDDESLVASLSGDTDLPVAGYDMAWDGGAAADRVFKWAGGDVGKISKAFLWKTAGEPADQKQGYDLPFADIVDGELKIVPRAVQAIAGGHGVGQLDGISAEDEKAIKSKIGVLYSRVKAEYPDAPDNPFSSEGGQ